MRSSGHASCAPSDARERNLRLVSEKGDRLGQPLRLGPLARGASGRVPGLCWPALGPIRPVFFACLSPLRVARAAHAAGCPLARGRASGHCGADGARASSSSTTTGATVWASRGYSIYRSDSVGETSVASRASAAVRRALGRIPAQSPGACMDTRSCSSCGRSTSWRLVDSPGGWVHVLELSTRAFATT